MDPLSIAGLLVGIIALIQAAWYNHSANILNKKTEQMQNYIENTINHSNLINMYSFLSIRDISKTKISSDNDIETLSFVKDTIIFNKGTYYSKTNAEECQKIIFDSGVIKPKLYSNEITSFLKNDTRTLKITLKSELSKGNIENFLSMSAKLLDYNITLLHNIHF